MASKRTRIERDSMGEMRLPKDVYYGASTQRAVLNFPVSNLRFSRAFIKALALIKFGAAEVNRRHNKLSGSLATAIKKAALEVAAGRFDSQFVVDIFQTGSGTSTNMNANEVIANRAIELLGGDLGDRLLVHPNDHVNLGMSSNDAIPTATHLAALLEISEKLLPALNSLQLALANKARAFAGVIKTGRTHLQDATPVTLGQEFGGYAAQVANCIQAVRHAEQRLQAVALGGTAVGTGVNTRADFAASVLNVIARKTGITLRETDNHFQAQGTLDAVVEASGALRTTAVSLMKVANDIRWLGCGPRSGFGEILLPEVQPGSSIMPGKVNPVIAESVCQVAAKVIGNDATIVIAGQSGNFELNVMQPVAAFSLLQSIELLANSADNFRLRCIDGITATERGPASVEAGLALCTALVPAIGYDAAAAVAHEAALTGETVRQAAGRLTTLNSEQLTRLLDPLSMISPEAVPAADMATSRRPTRRGKRRARSVVLGMTGGIACGKNAVGDMLAELGAVVVDTDVLAHQLLAGPNPTYRAILKRFGADICDSAGGPVNRKKLGARVFGNPNPQELADLNKIMHPAINRVMNKWIRDQRKAAPNLIVALVPLLFECSMERYFDEVWTVIVEPSIQLARLKSRNGLTDAEAQARIAAQMPQSEKARRSRRVIDNSGTLQATRLQVAQCVVDTLRCA